jgi:CHAT domain-containing protein
VIHFAAHAVTDDTRPERSAIVLAPGDGDEDGLLQIREIVELDLKGPLVILSACRSASGSVLAGEGVMGLARAFLQAGARVVVGSLWPLRDDDAGALGELLASNLARGASVSDALASARRTRSRTGAPIAAWAGVIAIGDGDFVPFPREATRASQPLPMALTAVSILVAVLLLSLAIRKRSTAL